MNKKRLGLAAAALLLLAAASGYFLFIHSPGEQSAEVPNNQTENEQPNEPETEQPETPSEAPEEPQTPTYDIDSPSSITVVVNKNRPLPADYVPNNLVIPDVRLRLSTDNQQMKFRSDAVDELKAMFDAARADGVTLVFGSGYRSYALQKQFYDSYVARDGQAEADRYSARPGTSEHQTGLSFDATSPDQTCHLIICFEDTPQGQWLAEHAHEYGFTLRYRENKEAITGYQYEPWHFRFVGKDLAAELHRQDLTLEEYFKL